MIEEIVNSLRRESRYKDKIEHIEILPSKEAIYGKLKEELSPSIENYLLKKGIRLYIHQCDAIEKLREDLITLPEKEEYSTLLFKLIIEGIISVGGGEVVLGLNERDYETIDSKALWAIENEMEKLLEKPAIVKKGDVVNIIGGCIVKTSDNLKICNNSLEAVFERNLEDIKGKVSELLF